MEKKNYFLPDFSLHIKWSSFNLAGPLPKQKPGGCLLLYLCHIYFGGAYFVKYHFWGIKKGLTIRIFVIRRLELRENV